MKVSYPYAMACLCRKRLNLCLAIVFAATGFTASSQNLSFVNYQLESGTNLAQGSVYRFTNVSSAGNVDALVTVSTLYNVVLKAVDSFYTGTNDGFQPMVSSNNGSGDHYALFNISFVQAGTSTPIQMAHFQGIFFDVNGSNQINEYAATDMSNASWQYASSTPGLTVVQSGGVITGTSTNFTLTRSIDTANKNNSFIVSSPSASSFNVKFGYNQINNWSGNDEFSILFQGVPASNASLPVTLINWSATYANNATALKWTTSVERNASHFIVERSFNGVEYSDIAMLFAIGNSDVANNYAYTDKLPAGSTGVIYYRLKMVDMDGSSKTSDVRVVRIGKSSEGMKIMAYPNPVVNDVKVTIPQAWQGKQLSYQLTNASGQVITSYAVQNASQTEIINMAKLPAGMYIMRVINGNETAVQAIIKSAK